MRQGDAQELLRHALYRLGDSAKPLNCYRFAYCWATVARMFPPGRRRVTLWHEGVALRGDYYWAWRETSVDGLLADLGLNREAFEPWMLEAFEAGFTKVKRRKTDKFMRADTMAKMLDVDRAERALLQLRHIGATDYPKAERQADAKPAKREYDRASAEGKRRKAGATPRTESCAAVKPWEYFGEKRGPFYQRPKAEREAMRVEAVRLREAGEKPTWHCSRTDSSHEKRRKPESAEQRKQWEIEGVSRHTWYRHRAKAKAASNSQAGTDWHCPRTNSSPPAIQGIPVTWESSMAARPIRSQGVASPSAPSRRRADPLLGGPPALPPATSSVPLPSVTQAVEVAAVQSASAPPTITRRSLAWINRDHTWRATSGGYTRPHDAKRRSSADPSVARSQVLTPAREGRSASVLWRLRISPQAAACLAGFVWVTQALEAA